MPPNREQSPTNSSDNPPERHYHRQLQWFDGHSFDHNGQKHSTMVSMVEDMKVLTKQQIKSSEMMISTVEAMGAVIEQQKKTSEMLMEMVRQMTDNDTHQTKEGILDYVQEGTRYGDVTNACVKEM